MCVGHHRRLGRGIAYACEASRCSLRLPRNVRHIILAKVFSNCDEYLYSSSSSSSSFRIWSAAHQPNSVRSSQKSPWFIPAGCMSVCVCVCVGTFIESRGDCEFVHPMGNASLMAQRSGSLVAATPLVADGQAKIVRLR